jgi:putative glycosyltransferase (TIGR04348 family)
VQLILVTPAAPGSRQGNRVTAERWQRLLAAEGHEVRIVEAWDGEPCDALVALHARKSAPSVRRYRAAHPTAPLVVTLTGTDVYGDLAHDVEAMAAVETADRLVALQPLAAGELPPEHRGKVRVLWQSATAVDPAPAEEPGVFAVCVLAHLRAVKDPLRAAHAARLLPPTSRVVVRHAGRALDPALADEARAEMAANRRYRWLGELPREGALALLAGSRLLVVSSLLEGGANVVSEAIAAGVPVLASRIPGSVGLLGESYPGYFPVGDGDALAVLLHRAETDAPWLADLQARCRALQPLVDPAREQQSWCELLAELAPRAAAGP